MKNKRKWLIIGTIMVSLGLAELGRMVFERTDIWWTPMNHALSLDDARARVLIYVQGQPSVPMMMRHLAWQKLDSKEGEEVS